eukprot:PhM_4_TR3604/c0_g1_i1/m.631
MEWYPARGDSLPAFWQSAVSAPIMCMHTWAFVSFHDGVWRRRNTMASLHVAAWAASRDEIAVCSSTTASLRTCQSFDASFGKISSPMTGPSVAVTSSMLMYWCSSVALSSPAIPPPPAAAEGVPAGVAFALPTRGVERALGMERADAGSFLSLMGLTFVEGAPPPRAESAPVLRGSTFFFGAVDSALAARSPREPPPAFVTACTRIEACSRTSAFSSFISLVNIADALESRERFFGLGLRSTTLTAHESTAVRWLGTLESAVASNSSWISHSPTTLSTRLFMVVFRASRCAAFFSLNLSISCGRTKRTKGAKFSPSPAQMSPRQRIPTTWRGSCESVMRSRMAFVSSV